MISDLAVATLDELPSTPFLRNPAVRSGLSGTAVRELLQSGLLRSPLRGVLVRTDTPDDLITRAAAVRLVLPAGAALCRQTAAWLWGIDARAPGGHLAGPALQCTVPIGTTPIRRPGVQCFVSDLTASDLVGIGGLPCTTATRTAIDLARWSSPGMGLGVLDAMARAGLIDPETLLIRIERWRGARHVAKARRLITLCNPLAESFGESWLRLRFHDAGFATPELQIRLADRNGVEIYRLDLGYPELRHAWEYDGEEFHLGPAAEAGDRRRRADIERRWGWDVVGVGKNLVLGPSMALELGVAEVLGVAPAIGRRRW